MDAVTGEGAKRIAHVRFDSAGPKKLLIKIAPIEKIFEESPAWARTAPRG